MKLNWFSPLPPARTGIAEFTRNVLPALRKSAEITLWTNQKKWDSSLEEYADVCQYDLLQMPWPELNQADLSFYNIGNNHIFHGSIWTVARKHPGVVVLHDLRLHNFFDSLYRDEWQDPEGYFSQMERYYGTEGLVSAVESVANGGADIYSLSQRYPLTPLALENSLGALVHTEEAYKNLKQANRWLVAYASLPFSPEMRLSNVETLKTTRASRPPYRLVVFGFISRNRRLDNVFEALATFPEGENFHLDIYGEIWDTSYLMKRIDSLRLGKRVTLHGFVSEAALNDVLASADLAINLRYPTMGEASISQLRIWAYKLPSLVTRVGWYGGLPSEAVAHVDPDREVAGIQEHLRAFLANPEHFAAMGERGYQLLQEQHSPEAYARAVFKLAKEAIEFRPRAVAFSMAERVGAAMSPWADRITDDETLRRAALEIYKLTNK